MDECEKCAGLGAELCEPCAAKAYEAAACRHPRPGRIGDHDACRVFLFCWDCGRILGEYDPARAGSFSTAAA